MSMNTGFKDLDRKLGELKKGEVTVIAAPEHMGKSSLAISIMEHTSIINKDPCLFLSCQLSKEQMANRMLCSLAKSDVLKVKVGLFQRGEWPKLIEAASDISESAIFIEDVSEISFQDLMGEARGNIGKQGIKLVIIDGLESICRSKNVKKKAQEMLDVMKAIKIFAEEFCIHVICTVKSSDMAQERPGHRPVLSDLREYEILKERADNLLFIYREEYYEPTAENKRKVEIIITKNGEEKGIASDIVYLISCVKFMDKEKYRFENWMEGL